MFTAMLRGLELMIMSNTSPIEFQDLCMVDMHAILGHSSILRSQRTQSERHQDRLLSVYCTPNQEQNDRRGQVAALQACLC